MFGIFIVLGLILLIIYMCIFGIISFYLHGYLRINWVDQVLGFYVRPPHVSREGGHRNPANESTVNKWTIPVKLNDFSFMLDLLICRDFIYLYKLFQWIQ